MTRAHSDEWFSADNWRDGTTYIDGQKVPLTRVARLTKNITAFGVEKWEAIIRRAETVRAEISGRLRKGTAASGAVRRTTNEPEADVSEPAELSDALQSDAE